MDEEGDIPVGKMKKSTIWRCILCILALPLSSGRHHSVAETYYQDVDLLQRSRPIIQNSKERRQYSPINTSYNEDGATSDEVCLANFQLNADTIIRTQDSRIMGAKYINETELPSKDQCLLWCCQVNGCNVIVFEEKVSNYQVFVYLFTTQHRD